MSESPNTPYYTCVKNYDFEILFLKIFVLKAII